MRVLFLTHRLPYAPNRGDRIRAFHLLKELSRQCEVDVLSLVHDDAEAAEASVLTSQGVRLVTARVRPLRSLIRTAAGLLTTVPATHTMLDAGDLRARLRTMVSERPPDVVLAYCSGMARLAFDRAIRDLPLVVDMVDVDSLKWKELAARSSPPKSWLFKREARLLARFERALTHRAVTTMVTTEAERHLLGRMSPSARIEVVQNGVDFETFRPPENTVRHPTIVFCGVMNYAPNVEGAVWLATQVWPLVRRTRPDARLQLVGASPSSAVSQLASPAQGIEVTGTVADVRSYLWHASGAAAPLFVARGIQNKVLEAVAAGLPVVVTSKVASPLPPSVRANCQVADDAAAFAAALLHALDGPSGRQLESVDFSNLSWLERMKPVLGFLEAAVRR